MAGYIGKTTNLRTETTAVQAQAEREDQWSDIDGEIVDFNPETQTITVQPLYKPRVNGQTIDMPVLYEVPMRFPRSGGFVMTSPIKPGDKVRLRPMMRSSENYHEDGEWTASDSRSFSLADYEAYLDGGESLQQPIGGFNNEAFEIRGESGFPRISMTADGMVIQVSDAVSITMGAGGITLKAPRIDMEQ